MKQQEYTLFDGTPSFIITPDEGKVLVRKSDGQKFFGETALGLVFVKEKPVLETPDDYEEQDAPVVSPSESDTEAQYKSLVEAYIRAKYSISDELAILRQRDSKPEEFSEYFNYCEACKSKAKDEVSAS